METEQSSEVETAVIIDDRKSVPEGRHVAAGRLALLGNGEPVNPPTSSELESVRSRWPLLAEHENVGGFLWKYGGRDERGGRVVLVSEGGEEVVVLCQHPFDHDVAFFLWGKRESTTVACHCLVCPWLCLALKLEEERLAELAACPPDPSAPEPRLF